jgi:hypothetical protein
MTKQAIGIGSSANDGTGDTIRDSFDKCNDNFTELYSRMGPYNGNKAANFELQKAIKTFQINVLYQGQMLYLSKVENGTPSGGNYVYTIDVHETGSFSGAGAKICTWTITVASQKTGLELILVGQIANGRFCYLGIDWSLLTPGTTYTASNYPEGAIFAAMTTASVVNGSGETDGLFEEVTVDDTVVDGSKLLYVCNPAATITVKADVFADIVGAINLVNINDTNNVNFSGNATETFNGVSGYVDLKPGNSCTIYPYDGNFIVTGNYDSIVAP